MKPAENTADFHGFYFGGGQKFILVITKNLLFSFKYCTIGSMRRMEVIDYGKSDGSEHQ